MFTNTADFGNFAKGELVIHWTADKPGTAPKRTTVACGKKGRKSYAMVHGAGHSHAPVVNCIDCLKLQAN